MRITHLFCEENKGGDTTTDGKQGGPPPEDKREHDVHDSSLFRLAEKEKGENTATQRERELGAHDSFILLHPKREEEHDTEHHHAKQFFERPRTPFVGARPSSKHELMNDPSSPPFPSPILPHPRRGDPGVL